MTDTEERDDAEAVARDNLMRQRREAIRRGYERIVRAALDECDICPLGEPGEDFRVSDEFCNEHFEKVNRMLNQIKIYYTDESGWDMLMEVETEIRDEYGFVPINDDRGE